MNENTPPTTALVPTDPMAVVRPGDPDPFFGRIGTCGFQWFDRLDRPGIDHPWSCHRDTGHHGRHIATAPGSHVAATT